MASSVSAMARSLQITSSVSTSSKSLSSSSEQPWPSSHNVMFFRTSQKTLVCFGSPLMARTELSPARRDFVGMSVQERLPVRVYAASTSSEQDLVGRVDSDREFASGESTARAAGSDAEVQLATKVAQDLQNLKELKTQSTLMNRIVQRKREKTTYLVAAIASSVGVTALAAAAVIYRFASQMQGGEMPYLEICGTFALAVGAAVGMEFWARWAHKALWHDSLWHMHESHHRPREGPFELNDVFAIINAGPAIALLAYGFFNPGLVPGLCFGAGLGITVFGMAYMFVHDGMVHRRFPVGPIADVPYLQRVAAAHQLHHADKFEGVPFGLFLGPHELEQVGGNSDLEELLVARTAGLTKK